MLSNEIALEQDFRATDFLSEELQYQLEEVKFHLKWVRKEFNELEYHLDKYQQHLELARSELKKLKNEVI